MGAGAAAVVFKKGELAVRQRAEPVLTAIKMPEVEITLGAAADAPGAKTSQRGAMPGAIIEIAGVADCVGLIPAQAKGTVPAGGGA